MLICRHCGWENPGEAAFCTNCGRGLARGRAGDTPRFRTIGARTPSPDVLSSTNAPPMPRLRAPITSSARSAPTLLDFRMPKEMLEAAKKKALEHNAPESDEHAEALDEAMDSQGESERVKLSEAPVEVVLTQPDVLDGPSTVEQEPVDLAPSIIVELSPVVLETLPPSEPPPPIADPDSGAPSPIFELGEPVSEPTVPLEALRSAPSSGAEVWPPVVQPLGTPPPRVVPPDVGTVNPEDQPLPGTEQIVPAAEIALSTRPPKSPKAVDLGATIPAMSLGDIARALRNEAGAGPSSPSTEVDFGDSLSPFDDVLEISGTLDFPAEESDDVGFEADLEDFSELDEPPQDDEHDELASEDALVGALEALSKPKTDLLEKPKEALAPTISDLPPIADPIPAVSPAWVDTPEAVAPTKGPPPLPSTSAGYVLRRLNAQGLDQLHRVEAGGLEIGKTKGDLQIDDAWCSPQHARIALVGGRLLLEDLGSLNGVWLRLRRPISLRFGDRFMAGAQVIEVREVGNSGLPRIVDQVQRLGAVQEMSRFELCALGADGAPSQRITLPRAGCRIGRHIAEFVFTDDNQLSTTHAVVRPDRDGLRLDDLQSRNGTWIRLTKVTTIDAGDTFMTGRTIWRVDHPIKTA